MSTSTGNTKYGSGALQSNSTIDGNNSAFGIAALGLSTEKWNTAVGAYSGFATTSGISNTSVGTNTLLHNTSGNYNTALGTAALCVNTLGTGNTAVGSNSLEYSTTGGNNTIIGTQTGGLIVTGSNNICLGYKAGTSASSGVDYSNCIVIGNNIFPTASAQAIIGDGTQTSMNLVCSTNPTMSGYALPLSTDASNKIATCAWVQTAVGGGGTSLIPLNNTWTGTNAYAAPITLNSGASLTFPDSTVQTTAYTGSGLSLLASNNTWTGTNAFNNIVSVNTAGIAFSDASTITTAKYNINNTTFTAPEYSGNTRTFTIAPLTSDQTNSIFGGVFQWYLKFGTNTYGMAAGQTPSSSYNWYLDTDIGYSFATNSRGGKISMDIGIYLGIGYFGTVTNPDTGASVGIPAFCLTNQFGSNPLVTITPTTTLGSSNDFSFEVAFTFTYSCLYQGVLVLCAMGPL